MTKPRPALLVLGSLLLDDVVHADGTTAMAQMGGAAAYAAAAARLCGAQPEVCAWVGHDAADRVRTSLKDRGIGTSGLLVRDEPQPRAWQLFDDAGHRTEVFRTSWQSVRYHYPRPEEIAPVSTFQAAYLFTPDPRTYVRKVRELGVQYITWEPPDDLVATSASHALECLAEVDVATPNFDEWRSLLGVTQPEDVAQVILDHGCPLAVVRLGAEGALLATTSGSVRLPAEPADSARDLTGAGNAFSGAVATLVSTAPMTRRELTKLAAGASVAASMTIEADGLPRVDDAAEAIWRARRDDYLIRNSPAVGRVESHDK